jgi:tetratricopeptide (TPR) repeat protein
MVRGIVLLLIVLLLAPQSVLAQRAKDREVQRTTGLSQDVYEKVTEIQTLAEAEEYGKAEAMLLDLLDDKLSSYEQAQAWFLMGFLRYQKEDVPGALEAYRKVMATEDLPIGMQVNVLRTLSQLNMMAENYRDSLDYVNQLIATDPEPNADNHILKAQILYQMERLDDSLEQVDTGIRLYRAADLDPRENWLLLKNAIFYNKNDYQGMLDVLRQLTVLYPRDRYLLNMAAIHGELGNSKTQLSLMEPLYERGGLENRTHIVNLASLYLLHDIPYKAAMLLDKEIKAETIEASKSNLDMLSQAWLLAARPEKAIPSQRQAARLADDGDGYVSLARTHMSLLEWEEAERALLDAFRKGDLRDAAGARLMLGMTQFNQKKFREARTSFARAGESPKMEKLSTQWLQYLDREVEQAELARSVGMDY